MSLNKIKSLRLQRSSPRCETSSKVEDTSMTLEEESKSQMERLEISSKNHESHTPLHSTPKRSSIKANSTQDQSGIEYGVSPIMLPCTQDGGNEVAWDWQSPLTKTNIKRSKISAEPIGTPKRTTLLQKKRNSNSPLLYKPIKRKLIRSDLQQESIDKFTAEMKALSEQLKTEPRDENCTEKTDGSEDELLIQIDIADFVETETKFELTTSDDNFSHNNLQPVVKTSMDDLFDDSIDDSMVKCSQEVEEKLRLESCRENSSKQNSASSTSAKISPSSWHQQSYSRCLTSREKSLEESKNSSKSVNSSGLQKSCTTSYEAKKTLPTAKTLSSSNVNFAAQAKKNCQSSIVPKSSCINNNVSKVAKSTLNATVSTQDDFFDIPDDSFDDIIAVCVDAVEKSVAKSAPEANSSSGRYGKVYVSPHSNFPPENSPRLEASTAKRVLLPPPSQSSCSVAKVSSTVSKAANNVSKFSRSVSNDSLKPDASSQREMQKMTTITTSNNQGRKFFKTKSLSTSSFDDQDSITKNGNSANSSLSSKGWKSNMFTNGNVSSSVSSSQRKTGKNDLNGACFNAWPKENGKDDNRGICNVNRSGPREEDSAKLKKSNGFALQEGKNFPATGSQTTQKCTPEEIERKRLEAKMKLEAKRKLMARSTSAGALRQVKR